MGSGVSGSYKNTTGSNSSPIKKVSNPTDISKNVNEITTPSSPIRVRKKKGISDGIASGGGGGLPIGVSNPKNKKPVKRFKIGDTVVLIASFRMFVVGTIGIIKSQVDNDNYEVELFDRSNTPCGVFVIPARFLALL